MLSAAEVLFTPTRRRSSHRVARLTTCALPTPSSKPAYLFGTNEEGRRAAPPKNAYERFFYE